MRTIEIDGTILARHVTSGDFEQGLSFFSGEEEFIQVGSWSYDAGQTLRRHVHNVVRREVTRTQEALIVLSGRLRATIYDLEERFVEQLDVEAGDVLVLLSCGHGYEILEDGTRVIEVKNGPYCGAEMDRRRF